MRGDTALRWIYLRRAVFAAAALIFLFYALVLGDVPGREEIRVAMELPGSAAPERAGTVPGELAAGGLAIPFEGEGNTIEYLDLIFSDVPSEGADVQIRILHGDQILWGRRMSCEELRKEPRKLLYVNLPTKKGEAYRLTADAVIGQEVRAFYFNWRLGRETLKGFDASPVPNLPAPRLSAPPERVELLPASLLERARHILACLPYFAVLALLLHFFARPGRWLVFLFSLFTGFAAVGSRTLLYPMREGVSPARAGLFALACLLSVPVILLALEGLKRLSSCCLSRGRGRRMPAAVFCALVLAFQLVPLGYALYGLNPLVSSTDTFTAVRNAVWLGSEPFSDWIPPLYVLYVRLALAVRDHVSTIAFFNWAFWCFVLLRFFFWLRERGLRDGVLLAAALFSGVNTANVLLLNTGWKDIPYGCSLLWAFLCAVKLVSDPERYAKSRTLYLEMVLALAGTAGFRKNGILTALVLCLILIVAFRGERLRWAAVIGTLAAVLFMNGPLLPLMGAHRSAEDSRMYTGFAADVLSIRYDGGPLSEEAQGFTVFTAMEDLNTGKYSPTYYLMKYTDWYPYTFSEIAAIMSGTVFRNPVRYLRAALRRNDLLWGFLPGEISVVETVGSTYTVRTDNPIWTSRAPERVENGATKVMYLVAGLWEDFPVVNALFWRGGIWLWVSLLALLLAVRGGRARAGLIAASVLLTHIAGLLLASGYGGEFRFTWPQNLIGFFSLLMIPLLFRRGNTPEETP